MRLVLESILYCIATILIVAAAALTLIILAP
jgi:hypothetical protein